MLPMFIMSGALMFSALQMAFIGYSFFEAPPEAIPLEGALLFTLPGFYIYASAIVICLILSFIVPKIFLKRLLVSLPAQMSYSFQKDIFQRYFPSHIARFALLEAITIIGLMVTMNSYNANVVVGCAAISIVMMALTFPTETRIQNQIQDASGKSIRITYP